MTNNKQSMKLYTEEQILEFLENKIIFDSDDLNELTPIELPSDEEIFSESLNHKEPDDFNCGSQFVIDYINQQDK